VAFGAFEGSACGRYMSCPRGYQPTIFTGVFELRTGDHYLSMGAEPVDRYALVLGSSGAVAWVALQLNTTPPAHAYGGPTGGVPYTLRAYDKAGERVLDSGAGIVPDSLRLNGSTLTWTDNGNTRSAQI
jgi:hypothetical protein